jgi:hypothetical protein
MPHLIAVTVRKTIIGGHRLRARFFNEIKHSVGATVGRSSSDSLGSGFGPDRISRDSGLGSPNECPESEIRP